MTETPDTPTRRTAVAATPAAEPVKPYWLYRLAAWVVIVAGILFIVTTIFFAGFRIAGHGHHRHHHHGHHAAMFHQRGPGGPGGPGAVRPGRPGGAGGTSPSPGPGQPPQSIAPSTAPATP
ncbi:hypothetical protein [Mycobacterium noviomagense]|uniref:Proline rich protein n=1 Tax=Mycobacterium noviomagense TaxID=459858 RepID=A0ABX3T212_9MYCO|nr:hypothetical protein [Mycobacterium noviomagense]ORB11134.1 hypothetical protein BST37_20700 [Mycobacterium noviomagense]